MAQPVLPSSATRQRPARPRRLGLMVAATALALATAACGSQLDPDTVAAANPQAGGAALPGEAGAGTDSGALGTDSGAGTGTGTDTGTDTGSTGSSDSGSSGSTGGSGGTEGSGENAPDGGTKAASCDGFKNATGITDDKIVVGNSSDISGPVPGIFESAQLGTRAYFTYFNKTSDVCGRKIEVVNLDSRADSGADQQSYTRMCESVFASVGSMSAFDQGGAATAEQCGLPDIRTASVTNDRRNCSTCFSAQSVDNDRTTSAIPKFIVSKYGSAAAQKTAILYIDVAASAYQAGTYRSAWEKNGMKVVYFKGMGVDEFNYAPYVQEMKDAGVQVVEYTGPYQNTVKLLSAMKQQGFKPKVFFQDATIYDQGFVEQAGSNGEGAVSFLFNDMFTNGSNKEMQLYLAWLQQVKPGATPNVYGLYAWSAARLFVERAIALGGKLSRQTMIQELSKVRDWTSNGLHVPQQVGAKSTGTCVKFVQLNGGKWSQISPGNYTCGPLSER